MNHHDLVDSPPATPGTDSLSRPLEVLWLELTTRCNLECVHCYADAGPARSLDGRLRLADWMEAMIQASRLGGPQVIFIGGEPTLYPGLPDLLYFGRTLPLAGLEVFTNGCLLNAAVKDALRRNGVDLAFSVYALDEAVHDAITGRDGSLAKTLASIRWALDAGLRVRVAVIEMEANAGTAEATRDGLLELGVPTVANDRVRGVGRGTQRDGNPHAQLGQLCGRCGAGRLCLAASGRIFPCVFSRSHPVGHLDQGLAAALVGRELPRFLRDLDAARGAEVRHVGGGDGGGACATGNDGCPPDCLPSFCPPLGDKCGPNFCGPNTEHRCGPTEGWTCAVVRG